MGGSAYLLGGLMQGLGKGMELNYLQNRETALENLRNQRQMESEGRAETRTIAAEGRAATTQKERDERLYGQALGKLDAAGEQTRTTNEQEFKQQVQLVGIKGEEDRKTDKFKSTLEGNLARIRADLDQRNDTFSQKLRAQLDQEDDPVTDQVTDANGRVILITKRGRGIVTPYTEREKVDTANPYASKPQKRGPTPGNFDPDAERTPPAQRQDSSWYTGGQTKPAAVKTATLADLRDLAQKRRMTLDEARKWAQGQGITIK